MKHITLIIVFLISYTIQAQSEKINAKEVIDMQVNTAALKAEISKSGNYRDAFNSFFQLMSENLTNESKSLKLNFTLFDVKSIFEKDLAIDYNFAKETFSRNLQFNLETEYDGNFKTKGYTVGATYSLINKRDKDLADFTNTSLDTNHIALIDRMNSISGEIVKQIMGAENTGIAEKTADLDVLNKLVNHYINNEEIPENIQQSEVYVDFNNKLQSITFDGPVNKFTKEKIVTAKEMVDYVHALKKDLYDNLAKKPLWTVSVSGSTNENVNFNKASLSTIYLQGIDNKFELDLRSGFTYTDTLAVEKLKRVGFNIKAGVNYQFKDGNDRSLFEIKGYGEYNSILKNALPDEDKNTFLANADFRIRLSDDLWVPITIKYDIENSNFLGFLNITYNFDTNTD